MERSSSSRIRQKADDRLVEQADDFVVIEKRGEEGQLVAERDPRSL